MRDKIKIICVSCSCIMSASDLEIVFTDVNCIIISCNECGEIMAIQKPTLKDKP